jgi:hypothetical protein
MIRRDGALKAGQRRIRMPACPMRATVAGRAIVDDSSDESEYKALDQPDQRSPQRSRRSVPLAYGTVAE